MRASMLGRSRQQLLAEAQAAVDEAKLSMQGGRVVEDPRSERNRSPTDQVLDKRKNLRELEQQLYYVRWLRTQNRLRMRDTMQYTRYVPLAQGCG